MPAPSHVVVIGASAGGHKALFELLAELPFDFPAAVLIVQHLSPASRSCLAEMLGRHSRLPVRQVTEPQLLSAGCVYTAPPDHHLIVQRGGYASLIRTAKMHFTRPAADILFASAASLWGAAAIGVVLSGYGRDGTLGLQVIKGLSGTCIAQEPASADVRAMPEAAIRSRAVDLVLPPAAIGWALVALTMMPGAAEWFRSSADLSTAS